MGALTLAFGLLLTLSILFSPDCTVTSTVPVPLGTSTESCVSLNTLTEAHAVDGHDQAKRSQKPDDNGDHQH